jgi:hypothetical protein
MGRPHDRRSDTGRTRSSLVLLLVCPLVVARSAAWGADNASEAAPASAMLPAARAFLASLDPPRRARAALPFDSDARLSFSYLPGSRPGLSLKEMTSDQRTAALSLLRASLSERGFATAETIRRLEDVLREIEGWTARDPERYFLAVFGEPSESGVWGWRWEGHHLSLNWTLVAGGRIASAPQFLGANPADVRTGAMKGTRPLAGEEDLARSLVTSLDAAQRGSAILASRAPGDIVTGSERNAAIRDDRGIVWSRLNEEQRGLLLALIGEFASVQPPAVAAGRLERIRRQGVDRLVFAWMGGLSKGQGHYYRVQGPSFLIEYDNTQNGANHIHSVWRDFQGDFGRDLLEEHYRTVPHHKMP